MWPASQGCPAGGGATGVLGMQGVSRWGKSAGTAGRSCARSENRRQSWVTPVVAQALSVRRVRFPSRKEHLCWGWLAEKQPLVRCPETIPELAAVCDVGAVEEEVLVGPALFPARPAGETSYQHGEVQVVTGPVMGEARALTKYMRLRT